MAFQVSERAVGLSEVPISFPSTHPPIIQRSEMNASCYKCMVLIQTDLISISSHSTSINIFHTNSSDYNSNIKNSYMKTHFVTGTLHEEFLILLL
jgi:hypothetical protein